MKVKEPARLRSTLLVSQVKRSRPLCRWVDKRSIAQPALEFQFPLPQAKSRKFDEFAAISRNDEKARLDNYAIEIQNDPTSTAYVVIYPQRSARGGDTQRRSQQIVDYLVNTRHADAKRIVSVIGGARDELHVELWICPQGTTPQQP